MGEEDVQKLKDQVSERVAELLSAKGWSQSELARRSGLQKSNINKILQNGSNATIETLAKLGDAFGTPIIRVTGSRKVGTENPKN